MTISSFENLSNLFPDFFMQSIIADMRKVLAKNPQVEQRKLHRRVFLENIDPENQALMVENLSYLPFYSIFVLKVFLKFPFEMLHVA